MYTITKTQKRKKCFVFDGYRYLRDRIRNSNIQWPIKIAQPPVEKKLLFPQLRNESHCKFTT